MKNMITPSFSGYERIDGSDDEEEEVIPKNHQSKSYICPTLIMIIVFLFPLYLFFPVADRNLARECLNENYRSGLEIRAPIYPVSKYYIPMRTSHALDEVNLRVKYALIAIHGYGRRSGVVGATFCQTFTALAAHDDTVIIVPLFNKESMTSENWLPFDNLRADYVFWPTSSWIEGGDAHSGTTNHSISSFLVVDEIIRALNKRKHFPRLRRISVAGFSAGAQFVNRFSWASNLGRGVGRRGSKAHEMLQQRGRVPVKFIAGSSNSYLYFNAVRPATHCLLNNSAFNYSGPPCTDFEVPDIPCPPKHDLHVNLTKRPTPPITSEGGLIASDAGANDTHNCWKYNRWAMGMEHMPSSRLAYTRHASAADEQRQKTLHLKYKDIRFIFGSYDICNCNLPGFTNDPIICYRRYSHCLPNSFGGRGCCDTSKQNNMVVNTCGYRLQGPTRLQRGLLYMQYLRHMWSTAPFTSHGNRSSRRSVYRPVYSIVDEMRHNGSAFYASTNLLRWVRGKHA